MNKNTYSHLLHIYEGMQIFWCVGHEHHVQQEATVTEQSGGLRLSRFLCCLVARCR